MPSFTGFNIQNAAVCRAADCDADSHARPNGTAYDIGAYEGTGSQAKSSSCQTIGAGVCFGTGLMALASAPVFLGAQPHLDCSRGVASVDFTIDGSRGDIAGLHLDVSYDTKAFSVAEPAKACRMVMQGWGGTVLAGFSPRARSTGGELRLLVSGFTETRDTFGDGVVVSCDFLSGTRRSARVQRPEVHHRARPRELRDEDLLPLRQPPRRSR
jgi:hypothetical protein